MVLSSVSPTYSQTLGLTCSPYSHTMDVSSLSNPSSVMSTGLFNTGYVCYDYVYSLMLLMLIIGIHQLFLRAMKNSANYRMLELPISFPLILKGFFIERKHPKHFLCNNSSSNHCTLIVKSFVWFLEIINFHINIKCVVSSQCYRTGFVILQCRKMYLF